METATTGALFMGGIRMPQSLVCKSCNQPFVLLGSGVELVGESRVGYRHSCGAINELKFLTTDDSDRSMYGVVGVIRTRRGDVDMAA
jgi:hypothetical protein